MQYLAYHILTDENSIGFESNIEQIYYFGIVVRYFDLFLMLYHISCYKHEIDLLNFLCQFFVNFFRCLLTVELIISYQELTKQI